MIYRLYNRLLFSQSFFFLVILLKRLSPDGYPRGESILLPSEVYWLPILVEKTMPFNFKAKFHTE